MKNGLSKVYNNLRSEIITEILTVFKNNGLGNNSKYCFTEDFQIIDVPEIGCENLDYFKVFGDTNVIFYTTENSGVDIYDLGFEDLVYIYELLEDNENDIFSIINIMD